MPIMDGRRFLELRAQDPFCATFRLSWYPGTPRLPQPTEGIDAYLRKPVNVDRLIDVIEQHCD